MSEWQEVELGTLTTKIGSGATPRGGSNSYKAEGISLIRSQNVLDLQFSISGLAFIDDMQADALKNVTVKLNDVLLNITGDSVARACQVPDDILPARVNQHVAIIRSNNKKLLPSFLLYNLIAQKEELLSQSEIGATRRAITKGMIEKFNISLPPLPEQKAIAEVLSSLDNKIDLLHRQNKTLEQMAETLFRQWFVEEAGEDATLGDIIDFNPIYRIPMGGSAPYLEMKNVSTSTFNPEHWYYRDLTSGMKFQNGDSIIARITPCLENGKTSFIAFLEDGQIGWGSTEYIVMRMKEPFHKFISYLIAKDNDFRDFAISSMSGSSGRQRVQANTIKEYVFKTPTGEVIEKLNQQLEPIVEKLLYNAHQIPTLESLRDTLLPKLMSGEIRVAL